MKVLLDENIDVRLRFSFDGTGHEVVTVKYMGWSGVKNGQLLRLMKDHDFDVFIAVDKHLPYQQNLDTLPVTIFILDVQKNVLSQVKDYVPVLLERMREPLKRDVIVLRLS